MRVVNQQVPTPFRDIDVGTVLRLNLLEFAQDRRAAAVADGEARRASSLRSGARSSAMDIAARPGRGPAVRPLLRRRHRVLPARRPRRTRTAPTTSARSITSSTSRRPTSTPASGSCSAPTAGTTCRSRRAVRASTALPMVYKPVKVHDRELVDGGIISTTNVDIAVARGRQARDRRQPARPLRQRLHGGDLDAVRHAPAPRQRHGLRRRSATRRSSSSPTSACTRWRGSGSRSYPDVDILLIEPEPDDELMFQTSIMDFTKRVEIARHGFQSVTLKLAEDYETLQGGPRPPRHRDLRHARAQGRQARHPREGEDAGLAAHPRADDRARSCASRRRRATTPGRRGVAKKASS